MLHRHIAKPRSSNTTLRSNFLKFQRGAAAPHRFICDYKIFYRRKRLRTNQNGDRTCLIHRRRLAPNAHQQLILASRSSNRFDTSLSVPSKLPRGIIDTVAKQQGAAGGERSAQHAGNPRSHAGIFCDEPVPRRAIEQVDDLDRVAFPN